MPELGVNLDSEAIKKLALYMKHNAERIQELGFEMLGGEPRSNEPDYKRLYEQSERQLSEIQRENITFRKSVARRHNVDQSSVKIEGS